MSAAAGARPSRRASPAALVMTLFAAALLAWIVAIERMAGMDAGPGTDLGGLAWFLGVWLTMMAAMMLPSTAPMVLAFARVSRERRASGTTFAVAWVFVAGYLAVWTAFGLVPFAASRLLEAGDFAFLDWERGGPLVAGGTVALAGLYQLTPAKSACLRRCRTPLHFLFGSWRDGRAGALRMGAEHGAWCIGCCWGLMLVLFAVGVMSVFWMAVVAGTVFLEKVGAGGARLSSVLAVGLIVLGVWIAAAPSSVPGLTDPGGSISHTRPEMERKAP